MSGLFSGLRETTLPRFIWNGVALNRGLPLFLSPPICITREQVGELLSRLDQTLTEWEKELGVA